MSEERGTPETAADDDRGILGHSTRLFTIAGIEIRLDTSVVVIFALIVFSLATGVFPNWHPDWSPWLTWGTALVSGVLFFVSLLAHELAHSVVAQRYGIRVPRITLFLFGGMAETAEEPADAKQEFLIAVAGPIMSLAIGFACGLLASLALPAGVGDGLAEGDPTVLAELSPATTCLLWLGSINVILGIFNLIPGFPMDGGRVFRAAIWAYSGDQIKATRWASWGGRTFGWALMALGVLNLFSGQGLGGIWYILIGWFISNIARMSYTQLLTTRALQGFRVVDLMNTRQDSVPADLALETFIDDHLLRSTQQVWPVRDGERLLGFVCLPDVVAVDSEARPGKRVGDVMRPVDRMPSLDADAGARRALEELGRAEIEPLPVMRRGELVGFLAQGDVMRWMSLHEIA